MFGFSFSSLRLRLSLLVLLAVVPMAGLTLSTDLEQRRTAVTQVQDNALRLAHLTSANHDRLTEAARQLLVALGQFPAVRTHDPAACSALFADVLEEYPFYTGLSAARPDGEVFCSAVPPPGPLNIRDRAYFQRALATREFAIGEYVIGRITGKPVLTFAYPVLDDAGQVQSVVVTALDLAWLNQFAAQAQLPEGAVLLVVDHTGTVLARYPDPEAWVGQPAPETSVVQAMLTHGEGVAEATGVDGVLRLWGFAPLGGGAPDGGIYLGVGLPPAIAFAEADRAMVRNLFGLGTVALLALTATWVAGDVLVLRWVGALVQATKRLSAGDLGARTGLPHGPGELSQLVSAFDEMAESLEQLTAQERAARAEVEAARQRLAFLVEAGTILAASLDYETTLAQVTNLVVPRLADWCVVYVIEADGQVHPLAVAHMDPTKVQWARELQQRYPYDPSEQTGLPRVLRTGQPELYSEIPDALLESIARDAEHLAILRAVGLRSAMIVPLRAWGRTLGAITFASTQPGRRYGPTDLALAEELADRAAVAVDNARLYHETQRLNAELEQRVVERTAALEAANKELEAFAYSVSHDLRAPLRTIDGFSQALLEDYTDVVGDEGKDYLQRVRNASQHMARLIDDLLMLSRVTRSELHREPVDLSALARSIVAEFQERQPKRRVTVTVADGLAAEGDARLLRVALENLLGNAWKFTSKRADARIEFGVTRQDTTPVYYVRDNGVGFDMAYADKLFGAFQRLHSPTEFEGSGIGLATVQRVVRRHGGRIWADAAVNQGATFSFTLGEGAEKQSDMAA
ncbi:MAG: GAF domain-containing protein [Chloroflexi bacterium]|nr:GAF domain-containing protein [Chloroflexota bacterium]